MSKSVSAQSQFEAEFVSSAHRHIADSDVANATNLERRADDHEAGSHADFSIIRLAAVGIRTAINEAMDGYVSAWVLYAISGAVIGIISNGLFHVGLMDVVDVCLSLFLAFVALQIGVELYNLVTRDYEQDIQIAAGVYHLAACLLWFLLPFSLITGFWLYGLVAHQSVLAQSFMYNGYIGIFVSGYRSLSDQFGDFLGLFRTVKDATGAVTEKIDIDLVLKYLQVASILMAFAQAMFQRRQQQEG